MRMIATLGPIGFILGFAAKAFAQVAEPETVDQALGLVPTLMDLFKSGKYLAMGAIVTLILVFVFRKFVMPALKLGAGVLPIISAVLGVVAGFAVSVAGGAQAHEAAIAMLSGPMASALYSSIFKYFLSKPEEVQI